jgi:hypothetical protein
MITVMAVIAVTAFLSGVAVAVFTMIVIGIRKADRPRSQSITDNTPLEAATRTILGAGTWPNGPALDTRKAS